MKFIQLIFLTFVILSSCDTSSKKTIIDISNDEVVVKICVNTSKSELENVQRKLKEEKNIDFDFSKTSFSSDGKIDQLDFVVKGPEGYTGHVNAELYMTDEYHGFRRDYRKNASKPFQCGAID
ncbi:MAG: hypothetical protein ACK5B9_07410 [Flavobacteriia bacterium]|jgi:hypothetical protein